MSSKNISCGGFKIDNDTIKEENGILVASELPTPNKLTDVGKVLMVNDEGEWEISSLPD